MKKIIDMITDRLGHLTPRTDRNIRNRELIDKMRVYVDRNGQLYYHPETVKADAQKRIVADQDRRAGIYLHRLQAVVREAMPIVASAIEAAKVAPGPEAALEQRTGKRGLSLDAYYNMLAHEESGRSRLSRELANATPTQVLAAYRAATEDPTQATNAVVVQFIEQQHARGWSGPQSDAPKDKAAVQELRKDIAEVQAARVPDELRTAEATIAHARKEIGKVEALGVAPVEPGEGE